MNIMDFDARQNVLKISLFILFLFPLFFLDDFYIHFNSHFTGSILPAVIQNQWHIVFLNIIIFVTFLIPLSFRRKINWKEYGIVTAFFVSLFVEMYGLPLTVFFASKTINSGMTQSPTIVFSFYLFGVNIAMDVAMFYATVLMSIGMVFIVVGWVSLYKGLEGDEIVTSGLYSLSRHPQYLGFLLIIIGWFIGWPTILSTVFMIILVYKYVKVCMVEEKELYDNEKYKEYMNRVPFLV